MQPLDCIHETIHQVKYLRPRVPTPVAPFARVCMSSRTSRGCCNPFKTMTSPMSSSGISISWRPLGTSTSSVLRRLCISFGFLSRRCFMCCAVVPRTSHLGSDKVVGRQGCRMHLRHMPPHGRFVRLDVGGPVLTLTRHHGTAMDRPSMPAATPNPFQPRPPSTHPTTHCTAPSLGTPDHPLVPATTLFSGHGFKAVCAPSCECALQIWNQITVLHLVFS